MQRVRADFLSQGEDGKLRFGDARFTGLAYQVGPGQMVEQIVEIAGGATTGPSTDWLALPQGGVRVDGASLTLAEDYGPYLFHAGPFTGIAYSFTREGHCYAETEYVNGYDTEASAREWYETGEPKILIGGGQYMSWFPDGRLECKGAEGEVLYSLNTKDGRLSGLVLRDPSLLDLETLRTFAPADQLMLLGAAIDTEVLRTLRERTPIGGIRQLRLTKTSVDRVAVEVLASFENLDEIWLDANPALGIEEAREIERRRPSCTVHVAIPSADE